MGIWKFRPLEGLPKCPLPLEVPQCDEWENWARNQLMAAGSDLLGKLSNIQVLPFLFLGLLHFANKFMLGLFS